MLAINTTRVKFRAGTSMPILEFLFLFLFFILPLVACPLWGQVVQKKELTPADYHLWGDLHLDKISLDEKWASYRISYENAQDTVFVQNLNTSERHYLTGGKNTLFADGNFFLYDSGNELNILNLKTLKKEKISDVKQYKFDTQTNQLVILLDSQSEKNSLLIRSLKTGTSKKIKNISEFALSTRSSMLAINISLDKSNQVALVDLNKPADINYITTDSTASFTALTWEKNGRAITFLKQADDQKINQLLFYTLAKKKLYHTGSVLNPDFFSGKSLVYDPFFPLVISDDLKKVFFTIQNDIPSTSNTSDKNAVEIWNGNDQWVFAQNKYYGNFQLKSKVAVWTPSSDQLHQISSDEQPKVMLSANLNYAVLSNPKQHKPESRLEDIRDFHVMNLKTFKSKVFLEKQPFEILALSFSPQGKYFAYFREGNWWIYDFLKDTHTNITAAIGLKFSGKVHELIPDYAFGSPGWTLNDKEILLYDQFDIWAITPDAKSFKRLTSGRESGIKYRIPPPPDQFTEKQLYDGPVCHSFNLKNDLFLRASGQDGKTGYFRWNQNLPLQKITYGDYYVDELKYSSKMKKIICRQQRFDKSPELVSVDPNGNKNYFFKSNQQQEKYFWGKSELIEFKNSKGRNLKGVLYYPANYDPSQKYPMIVKIYENQSHELHIYNNPTFKNTAGFNITLMTSAGYFVLLPDIFLEFQNPGISAADCTISAVNKVIEKGIVDPSKIGLQGHSFGSYEASFIITQTNLFAAAISSGGITDLFSYYYSLGRSGAPESWRFYGEEWNMGKSPFELPGSYTANSPIVHAENITTPVLLWTGKNDQQVNPYQTYEFYLALRELRKKTVMLVYPSAGHLISDPVNQKDITVRTLEWFNYYLKDNHSYTWISTGTK